MANRLIISGIVGLLLATQLTAQKASLHHSKGERKAAKELLSHLKGNGYPKSDGIIVIQVVSPYINGGSNAPEQKGLATYTIGGNISDKNDHHLQLGTLHVGDVAIEQDPEHWEYVQSVEAKFSALTTKIVLEGSKGETAYETELHLAPPIVMHIPDVMKAGAAMQWNADPANERGLILRIENFATRDDAYLWGKNVSTTYRYLSADEGHYVLTEEDLKDMRLSDETYIGIKLMRGDWALARSSQHPRYKCEFRYYASNTQFGKLGVESKP